MQFRPKAERNQQQKVVLFCFNKKNVEFENNFILVYVCVCLAGKGYSIGIFHDILFGPEKGRFIIA